jgi:hypothetical protein
MEYFLLVDPGFPNQRTHVVIYKKEGERGGRLIRREYCDSLELGKIANWLSELIQQYGMASMFIETNGPGKMLLQLYEQKYCQ